MWTTTGEFLNLTRVESGPSSSLALTRERHKTNRLQYIFFCSSFHFDSLKASLNPSKLISFGVVRGSTGTISPRVILFGPPCVSSIAACRPPLQLRALISSAGLITQQMGTECSVTKTKTNALLDYGSACVCVWVPSDRAAQIRLVNRFLSAASRAPRFFFAPFALCVCVFQHLVLVTPVSSLSS